MADKQRKGIDLMKKVMDKREADMELLRADNNKRMKKYRQHPAM